MQKYCFHCMKPLEASPACRHCGYNNVNRLPKKPYQLHPGTVLHQRYLTGLALGEGGFGITYIGLDITLGKRVAIKEFFPLGIAQRVHAQSPAVEVMLPEKADFFARGVERFLSEAKSVAAFTEEEGIVDVLDYFQENGTAYIVMEYLEGKTLRELVAANGKFPADRLIALTLPVMQSLRAMHAQGMIHRDISPDNLMLTKNGDLKLMDFGSARFYMSSEQGKEIMLKPGYAPEEQYRRNSRQGPYTDVYALCATIYACITGIVPMNSPIRVNADTLKPPSQLGVRITPQQEYALMHGLAPSAQYRTPDMEQLVAEFTAQPRYTPSAPPTEAAPPKKKTNTPLIVTIVILSVLLVAGGVALGIFLFGNGSGGDGQSSSAPSGTTASTAPATAPSTAAPTQPTTAAPTQPTTAAPTEAPTEPPTEAPTEPPETTTPVTTHTVTFINWDGSTISTQTVEDGKAATAPPDPVKPEDEYYTYKFVRWANSFDNITFDLVVAPVFEPVLKEKNQSSTGE